MKTSPVATVLATLLLTLPGAAHAILGGYCDQACINAQNAQNAQNDQQKEHILNVALLVAAAAGVITYIAVHAHHQKNASEVMTGCVQVAAGGSTITNEKNRATFPLAGHVPPNGGRLTVRGTWSHGDDGSLAFQAERVVHDYGACR